MDRPRPAQPFSERDFYLREFRGRTLGIACRGRSAGDARVLAGVVRTLTRHGTRVVVVSPERRWLESVVGSRVVSSRAADLEPELWRALDGHARAGLVAKRQKAWLEECREAVLRLRLFKWVWIDPAGGLPRGDERRSFVHRSELRALLRRNDPATRGRRGLLRAIDALLAAGQPALNVCTLEGLDDELFTYAGSGTLFTPKRYVAVRDLGLDDFDAAHDLVGRGVAEGYLAPRPPAAVDRILARGFGAFVEDRYLAGIGALLLHPDARSGEIAALYTVTRFLGEGMGGHLVRYAVARARRERLRQIFACTTSERVGAFFARQGFAEVACSELPASRWRGYDRERRALLHCYRKSLVG